MTTSIAIVNTSTTFSTSQAKDALDVALIFGSYEVDTHLFFIGDGVWQLMTGQHPETINTKNILKTFSAFEFYDLDKVYVCKDSLAERGLLEAIFNIDDVVILSAKEIAKELESKSSIFTV